jgi:NTP pyrophosphatase (non-canonical NTP hydrolase)
MNEYDYALLKSLRPFSRWAAGQIEMCCQRNDDKPAWEATHPDRLKAKITEEYNEVLEALAMEPIDPAHVQWELTDLAATCFMMLSHFDAGMSQLNRGRLI